MQKQKFYFGLLLTLFLTIISPNHSKAWSGKSHLAIAKAAGYEGWYNAIAADIAWLKFGKIELRNHMVFNPPGTIITPKMVFDQVKKYNNKYDERGHLYGAIIASIRDYIKDKKRRKPLVHHLAFCVHYVGDLSQPLHNTPYNSFNRKHHSMFDRIINYEVLDNLHKIQIYPIKIDTEEDLASEIARIANLSMALGYKLEKEDRILTEEEAYIQHGHSASLFKAILGYLEKIHY